MGVLGVVLATASHGCTGSDHAIGDTGEQQTLRGKCLTVNPEGACAIYAPSVTDLAVRPELYDGLIVQSSGFFSSRYEDRFLYASKEDYEYGNQSAAVPLELTAEQQAQYGDRQGRRVRLLGRVKNGKLADITSVDIQEFTRTQYNAVAPLPPPPK